MPKFFLPFLDRFGPSPKQPRLLHAETPSPCARQAGLGILLKIPGQPWTHVGLLLDGLPMSAKRFARMSPLVERSLVRGWHASAVEATPDWPYDLVVNDEGRALSLPTALTLRDRLDQARTLVIAGPAFLLKRVPEQGYLPSTCWPAGSIGAGTSRSVLQQGHMAELFDDDDLLFAAGTCTVNLTTACLNG